MTWRLGHGPTKASVTELPLWWLTFSGGVTHKKSRAFRRKLKQCFKFVIWVFFFFVSFPFFFTKTVSLVYFPATSWKWELMADHAGSASPWNIRHEMLRLKQLRDMGHGVCVAPNRAFERYSLYRCCSVCTGNHHESMTSINKFLIKCHPVTHAKIIVVQWFIIASANHQISAAAVRSGPTSSRAFGCPIVRDILVGQPKIAKPWTG